MATATRTIWGLDYTPQPVVWRAPEHVVSWKSSISSPVTGYSPRHRSWSVLSLESAKESVASTRPATRCTATPLPQLPWVSIHSCHDIRALEWLTEDIPTGDPRLKICFKLTFTRMIFKKNEYDSEAAILLMTSRAMFEKTFKKSSMWRIRSKIRTCAVGGSLRCNGIVLRLSWHPRWRPQRVWRMTQHDLGIMWPTMTVIRTKRWQLAKK